MTVIDRNVSAAGILDAVRELAPEITRRAPEVEAARRLPRDLLDKLIAAGCFRLLVPRSHGGAGADFPAAGRVLSELARADGSVGWTVMIGAGSWIDLAGLPRATFDALFAKPDPIFAGAFNPSGSIEALDGGGYRVNGRWGFASGCEHADWIWANCVEGFVDGAPQLRIAVFSPDQVVIEDTWDVSGLRGTGSHHFHVRDAVVEADHTYRPFVDEPTLDEPIVRIPTPSAIAMAVASVAVGVAQGAMDDIVALATEKTPLLAPSTLATNPHFQYGLATADTDLRAATSLLEATATATWGRAVAGDEFTIDVIARIRATAVWCTSRAAAIVDFAYRAGGGSSLYSDCALQRRLRDIHALTQHFIVKEDTLTMAGAVLAGQELTVPVF
jgi:alkylation response protein AidB-like acyl-CoA dehydrogenase